MKIMDWTGRDDSMIILRLMKSWNIPASGGSVCLLEINTLDNNFRRLGSGVNKAGAHGGRADERAQSWRTAYRSTANGRVLRLAIPPEKSSLDYTRC